MNNELSFEEKLEELEQIVRNLESGDVKLDNAIEEFNKAMKLASECNKTLENASNTINKVLNKDNEFVDFKVEE